MTDATSSEDETESRVHRDGVSRSSESTTSPHPSHPSETAGDNEEDRLHEDVHHAIVGEPPSSRSSTSSVINSPRSDARDEPIELEAVISCTSDGLVVCLRRARPMLPGAMPVARPAQSYNGVYAAPWATQPVFHPAPPQIPHYPLGACHPNSMQQIAQPSQLQNAFMQSIRDVAVFAWALTGINGSLVDYARGQPVGESQPATGFPIWNPLPDPGSLGKHNTDTPSGYASGSGSSSSASNDPFGFGDPGLH